MRKLGWVLALAALLVLTSALAAQTEGDLELTAARFYRGGTTWVNAFCQVPFSLVQPLSEDVGGVYAISVSVRDSSGLVLHESEWSQAVSSAVLRVEGTSSVEYFTFAAQPGLYTMEVAVSDSASGRVMRRSVEVRAFDAAPGTSDLLLAPTMRRGGPGDTVAAPGEVRKGTLFLTAATRPVLTPTQATLYYYLELYPGQQVTARVVARVIGAGGRELIVAPPLELDVPPAGGVVNSGLNLEGLPPGEYRLEMTVRLGDEELRRDAGFTMAGFDTDVALAQSPAEEAGRFAHLTEVQMDSLQGPLIHLEEADERGVYGDLSVEGKRNYLERFWAKRDPTPGTAANEMADEFYALVAEANRRFREGGAAGAPGWRTDRGRILIRYGEPEFRLQEAVPDGPRPWEVWRYATGRGYKYVFVDETGFGNWALVYSNNVREPTRAGWEAFFHDDDLRRVETF
ncbi:MAG: GWxTD domain-containing protein [Planctomycetota bacterium]|jgi:GWxTD domain-containing protein